MKVDGDLAELIGAHIGDGCISINERYAEYYLGGDLKDEKEYHNSWIGPLFNKKVMVPILGRKVVYKEHPKVGVYGFHIFNKKITDFFETLGIVFGSKIDIAIPNWIILEKEFIHRCLRGLFDTDGCLTFQKNYSCKYYTSYWPTIRLVLISKKVIYQAYEMLRSLGMYPSLKKPYKGKRDKNWLYGVIIYRKSDIELFMKKIGFKNSKHYTKWQIFKKLGYYIPNTTLEERESILKSL